MRQPSLRLHKRTVLRRSGMNYLNLFLIFLILMYVLQGWQKGFLVSLGNTIGMCGAWFVGTMCGPILASKIAQGSFYRFVLIFTEGSSHLVDQVEGHLLVSSLSQQQMQRIVDAAHLPAPFGTLVYDNMRGLVYGNELSTVGEYFDYTVTDAVVNIIAFLLVYALCRIVVGLVLNTINFASPFPMLRYCDGLCGSLLGLLRGCLAMYAVCMIIPILLISAPADLTLFTDIINGSSIASYFYDSDFLLNFIPGTIVS